MCLSCTVNDYTVLNIGVTLIDGWDITTSVKKNKRPPYWKSTFGFDFDHLPEICILFCIRLLNFVQVEAPTAEIWRHIHFSRWRPRHLNTTSGFVSVDVTAFRRSKSISKPNFVEISQTEAETFLRQYKMAWEGVNFFKIKNVSICLMLCYILWIQKCIFDACRLSLHNSTPSHCTINDFGRYKLHRATNDVMPILP